ncbi:hypothetical protein [Paenibacillus graminis]|uniref:hypothetical protein n=1 Tax=Paenibacillus graminis TaxID=189425 RepID=UPI002DBBA224|nr:hypothetical protein [Paenibacillus graminis]MEC0167863.1 hypothetical protein [Paenibacillus graminis]
MKYTSRYAELSFYVNGVERKFSAGEYVATSREENEVLQRMVDAIPAAPTTEEPAEVPTKPAPKPRKPAAKADTPTSE